MTGPLDPAQDPDRYDPARDPVRDPASDPAGRTLDELLGAERSFAEPRSVWASVIGLAGVLAFLAVVSLLLTLASPR